MRGEAHVWYWAIRGILGFISKLLFRVKIEQAGNVPAQGPVIVCANHISWWDPILVANAMRRPIHFMAKVELFRNPVFGYVMRRINAFPVDRGKPDLSAIRDSIAILQSGKVLGIFPEGTRHKAKEVLGEMHPGAALVALRTGSPVVPIAIRGRYAFRGTVTVLFGEPMVLEGSTGRASKDMVEGANAITEAITALWERLGEGVA
ncbi:MAG: lysophospholipid acyltransferase family protein [Bacillota bacterium]